ncbi:predicted protein [Lichtheimia corymbifera JMRC:FSU:9682]|uniref:Uncharacterized protein n=1 Tax=Lichtheimia corymbifera JMRC:FSU:9682 TaxID=1263082 RepID=A0A068RWI4_9FUNG|nr:predicted protein [Lichtheimia corymbifera JMRC:FSU:9682]
MHNKGMLSPPTILHASLSSVILWLLTRSNVQDFASYIVAVIVILDPYNELSLHHGLPFCRHRKLKKLNDGTRIICMEVRSAKIPMDYEDRFHYIKVFELLIKMKEMCVEQEHITKELQKEHVGLIQVDKKDQVKHLSFQL